MGDNLTKAQRTKCMSRIRSKWTLPEKRMHDFLKGNRIKHKMHPLLPGNPDILIGKKTAVFLHGCFWHKCHKHHVTPKSNKKYWLTKIERNVKKYQKNKKVLKSRGYKVICIWEHELKNEFNKIINRLIKND